jgi:hypothetical protein
MFAFFRLPLLAVDSFFVVLYYTGVFGLDCLHRMRPTIF